MGELVAPDWAMTGLKLILAGVVSVAAWRLRLLTWPGSAVMGAMGATILLLAGWEWLIPALAFFVTSTALGWMPDRAREGPEARTAWQVLANGAIAWVGVLLLMAADGTTWDTVDSLLVYVGALAAATADTWATELGVRFGGTPRDMMSGRALPIGASGGITSIGTVGAAMGALAIAAMIPWIHPDAPTGWSVVAPIATAGWLGAMADSLLGSVAQKRFRCRVCGDETELPEHCGTEAALRAGILTNNQVNWLCTLVGGFTSWAWLRW